MNSIITGERVPLALMAICLMLTLGVSAQVQTQTSTTKGSSTQEVNVERGEIVHISGNDLVVKMDDGTIRHFANVPESDRVTVDGRQLGIRDLKPGMKLERTLTVTTTPTVVTTVQTVTGKVWHVNPPSTVVLTLEDGSNQQFTIPKDQKFMVDGRETDAWGLKKGMKVAATKIVEEPVNVIEHERQVTGSMPTPPPAPPADVPILIASTRPMPALPSSPPSPTMATELPKTGTMLPMLGLLGSFAIVLSIALRAVRLRF